MTRSEAAPRLDFSGELAAIQQQMARSHDFVVRRATVLDALAAAPGERILEVGCGAGLCLREIAVAVGPAGRAVGIDISSDQIRAAETHCEGLANVEVRLGDLLALADPDGHFDATVSVQVLEYVADVDAALAEVARVTRVGGRFVNVATNWGSVYWSGGDEELTSHVLSAWESHAAHPNFPVTLPSLLQARRFDAVHQTPVTIMNPRFHPNTFSYGAARLMAAYALSTGALDETGTAAWLESLAKADADGTYFFSSVPVLTAAVRR